MAILINGEISAKFTRKGVWYAKDSSANHNIVLSFNVAHAMQVVSIHVFSLFLICLFREPRGFGFVQYVDPADAAEAKYHMDGQVLLGREVTVVFAEENRKKPSDMRARDRGRQVFLLFLLIVYI